MKGSLLIVSVFLLGLLLSFFEFNIGFLAQESIAQWVLYGLMFLVGVSIGSDKNILDAISKCNWRIILVPIATIFGTLIGVAIISIFLSKRSLWDCMAVGSGFGYYSLSSIFITEYKGAELGTIAITSNIVREIFTLLLAPLLVKWFSPLSPITSGGATTMDTTLPIIAKYSGKEWVVIAITHGVIVDLTVPFLVTFFCTI